MKKIHLGSDHAGFRLKCLVAERLADLGYEIDDNGCHSEESCDYPLIAHKLCQSVEKDSCPGILICGTGIGMSMAANRHPGIRAALCTSEIQARLSRRHNDANVLCLGARICGDELVLAIICAFLESAFDGGRHQRRIDELSLPPQK